MVVINNNETFNKFKNYPAHCSDDVNLVVLQKSISAYKLYLYTY